MISDQLLAISNNTLKFLFVFSLANSLFETLKISHGYFYGYTIVYEFVENMSACD